MSPLILPPHYRANQAIVRPAPRRIIPPMYLAAAGALRCQTCPFPYRRVYAWGGDFENSGGGLYMGDKASFITLYNSAIALVNSIDISSVPFGSVRWFNYGGLTSPKADNTYIDSGNVINNPTNLPGSSLAHAPCGTDDYGAITSGGSELSYMGLDSVGDGVNAGGYQFGAWIPIATSGPYYGQFAGWFAVSRIQVSIAATSCTSRKWSVVEWDCNGGPSGSNGAGYNIYCDCDSTGPLDCPACQYASITSGAICVDIPTSLPTNFTAYADPDLPCLSRYFVPGLDCADLV